MEIHVSDANFKASKYDLTITDDRYPGHVSKMAAREHVLGLAGEVMDMAVARHSDDDFLDFNDLVRTTSLRVEILLPWMPGTDKQSTTVVVREVGTKAL